ncbi:hypothetical protein [Actinoplanes sp. G11-F43]|uniref:hypothetical protein n=1 Tax=Actinoplanes sp. G11-F43 TaxID=3424130 RepID=UPI003D336979
MGAVLRVMTGWGLLGIGLLDIAVELDGGLTITYLVFHLMLCAGGLLLLAHRRPVPSRAALAVTAVPVLAGMVLQYPYRYRDGASVDWFPACADLVFWGCAGLLLASGLAMLERLLPERRTPVDLSHYTGHAEQRAAENVGGLP